MKRDDQERLLRDLLATENLARLRETSLAGMLGSARRRRRQRASLSAAGASAAVLLLALVLARRPEPAPASEIAPVATSGSRVKIVSDEELLGIFSDRSVALVGRPGEQRLLFLDATPAASDPGKIR